MNAYRKLFRIATPLIGLALVAGCLGQESGIDNRHLLGVAIIPPVEYTEIEAGDESANDTIETAEDFAAAEPPIYVGYQYLMAHGSLADAGYVLNMGYTGDADTYKLTSGFAGDISFELQWGDGDIDYDLFLYDFAGTELAAANGSSADFEVVDFTIEEEQEVYLQIQGKKHPDGYDGSYTLVMTGLDPNEAEPVVLGAYLKSEVEDLGDPVAGTSVEEWTLDEGTYRYWAPFDMFGVREVIEISDVFIDPELEDFIDNNCDGLTDRGTSDEDRDEDGARISDGDCNDTDPTVRPGFPDIAGNGRDDDCDGWADNGVDGTDDDGDGMSEFEGDCNDADPDIYQTLQTEEELGLLEDGKDNNCDGTVDDDDPSTDGDSPEDNDADGWTVDMGDCNDVDPTIHPCDEDGGEICIDYRDGKDNDCDADPSAIKNDKFDENFEYHCPDGGCSPRQADGEFVLDPALDTDDEGDGYSENNGDCDDTLDNVFPGNYELRTETLVNNDIDKVYLYGGTIATVNATASASGDLMMCDTQEVILSELPDNTTWDMNEDWQSTAGQLVPSGMPEVPLACMMPPLFGLTITDEEPNDCDINGAIGTWDECAQEAEGVISIDGYVDRIQGTFETIVQDTWDGDNDTYHVIVQQDGYVNGSLDWDGDGGDMDWYFFCWFGDEFNPWNWYYLINDTTDLSKPEEGVSVVPLPAGTECYAWLVGYSGNQGHPYKLKLWMTPEEI